MKSGRIENKLYRREVIKKYHEKCVFLGSSSNITVYTFLNIRLLTTIIFLLFLFIINYKNLWLNFLLTIIYYHSFSKIFLDYRIEKYRRKLEKEAILFFEVVALSLESGRNLTDSLNLAASNVEGDLSLEFKEALREMNYGKSLEEALETLKIKIPSLTIQNMILSLRQSNIYGNNIEKTLHQQMDYIRQMRIMEIKERINKMPIQVSVVSVLLFVPIILLLILSPVIIQFLSS